MRVLIVLAASLVAYLAVCPSVRADGIDILPYVTRVSRGSPVHVAAVVLFLLFANYALNVIVIGVPAIGLGHAASRVVARDLVPLTILGQVADRVGAVLAIALLFLIDAAIGFRGEGSWAWPLLVCNFVLSATAVFLLAYHFLNRRWGLARRLSIIISVFASILTNPVLWIWWRVIWLMTSLTTVGH